jgi:hypothetical protein
LAQPAAGYPHWDCGHGERINAGGAMTTDSTQTIHPLGDEFERILKAVAMAHASRSKLTPTDRPRDSFADDTQKDHLQAGGNGTQGYTGNSGDTGVFRDIQRTTAPPPSAGACALDGLEKKQTQKQASSVAMAGLMALSFIQFIAKAYEIQLRHNDNVEIAWQSVIFKFVWLLSGHPRMEKFLTNGQKALNEIEPYLHSWTSARRKRGEQPPYGLSGDVWYDWFAIPTPDARAEFIDLWSKIRYRPGHTPLQQAFDSARKLRLIVPDDIRERRPCCASKQRDESDYEFFIGLAGHLQVVMGDKPILLPCREVAEILRVSPITISRYRNWAQADGFLKLTKIHSFRSKGRGEASEFLFNTAMYRILSSRAQKGSVESFDHAICEASPPR